jgi:hypothetical protein
MLPAMDNMFQPPSGGSQDNWPTEQFGPAGGPPPQPRRSRSVLLWSAGIAMAALLAGGGTLAATELTSNSAPAGAGPVAAPGSAGTAGVGGQAAALNTILSSAAGPAGASSAATASSSAAAPASAASTADAAALSPAASVPAGRTLAAGHCRRAVAALRVTRHPRAARVLRRICRRRLTVLHALGGLHGQFTFKTKSGTRTIAFSRGVVQSVSTGQVVLRAADGTTWTWDLVGNTVIREAGKIVGHSALATGEQVFAGGQIVSGANDARLIVIRPACASSPG